MGRRVRGGGEAVKTRRRKKVTPKRRMPEVVRHRRSSAVARKTSVASLTTELDGALEQQDATAEVLRIIASSHGELAPVFDAILANATRLCEAKFGILWLREGELFRSVALNNAPITLAELRRREPLVRAEPGNALGRVVATRRTVHVDDIMAEPAYAKRDPLRVATVEVAGARTLVAVPMVTADDLIGALVIYRREVRRFTDRQIELVTSFANQAVIAIENARLLGDLRQRTADLGESLQHQTATSAVLQVISSSPGELKPVFQTILENATRLCAGKFGQLFLYEGGNAYRAVALYNAPPAWAEALMREPVIRPPPDVPLGRIAVTKQVTYLADIKATPSYVERNPFVFGAVELGGYRSVLVVPILKDNDLIGSINIMHQEVQPFTDNQIELVKSFAAQAVIAIENARLLNDLRQRTADLSESLQHQTATSEVLRVISAARGELGPTFKAILENATRICEASFGIFHLYDGEAFTAAECVGVPRAFEEYLRRGPHRPARETALSEVARTGKTVYVADFRAGAAFESRDPLRIATVELGGARSGLVVPMLGKDDRLIGAIVIYRQEVRPFTDSQIALVKSFAAQAIIAIENARLLHELQKRTDDLSEALQQQTATSEVLEVISRSAFDLGAVFETIVESSAKLCGADRALIFRFDGEVLRVAAACNAPQILMDWLNQNPIRPGRYSVAARAALERRTVQVPDVRADPEHTYGAKEIEAFRTVLGVPILKGDDLQGVILIYHLEVRPFSEKQIALIETFADQATIAIENVRLFDAEQQRSRELTETLQQQTATADVLKVISRSTFDLQVVLDALVQSAARLCEAELVAIHRDQGHGYQQVATHGYSLDQKADISSNVTLTPTRGSIVGRTVLDEKIVHVSDVLADSEYALRDWAERIGMRATLGVPLLREGKPIAVMFLARRTVTPFTARQIELATTFADQAVIAIENVRLFDEIQDKSRQLAEASQHKSQFLANMSHELRTPLNAILGYTELILDNVYGETPEKMRDALDRIERNGKHLLGLINDVLDLSKIEAGQLTLSLADYSLGDIVHAVYAAVVPLAAQKKLRFEVEVPPDLPTGRGDEHRLRQVLLNLAGNAIKFTDSGDVLIRAAAEGGSFTVAVYDTGPGISAADQGKLFQEFQQADNSITKRKGGTGLGLAISKRIIELHHGKIWVESVVGQGSTFVFTLPVAVEQ